MQTIFKLEAHSRQTRINLEATGRQTRCNLYGRAISKLKATCKSIRLSICTITSVDNMYDWDLVMIWWWLSNGSILVFRTYSDYVSNCIKHISTIYRSSIGTILTRSGPIRPATTSYDPHGSQSSHGSVSLVTVRIAFTVRFHESRFAWFSRFGFTSHRYDPLRPATTRTVRLALTVRFHL